MSDVREFELRIRSAVIEYEIFCFWMVYVTAAVD